MTLKLNINESFICRIWEGSESYYSNLLTSDGEEVTVIEVGNRNYDSGPDFLNSKIRIGGKTYSGDVEVHRGFSGWEDHNHKKDSRYNSVILQVVMWDSSNRTRPKLRKHRKLPTIILSKFLTRSINEIWQEIIENPSEKFKLPCYGNNENVSSETIKEFFAKLSIDRLELKARRFKQRLTELAKEAPRNIKAQEYLRKGTLWNQVFYEYLFEALGFSKNKEPMLKLTRGLRLSMIKKFLASSREDRLIFVQALAYGCAGFLFDLRAKSEYIDDIKRMWNGVKDKLNMEKPVRSEWQFFRMRPSNFPTLRLAYGAQLILRILFEDLFKGIVLNFQTEEFKVKECYDNLSSLLEPDEDYYWSKNYYFSKPSKKCHKLLGTERLNDILINVIIPLVYFYSVTFNSNDVKRNVISFYNLAKINSHNSILNVIETQLLDRRGLRINSPSFDQAAIQLYSFYCTRERCNVCDIGKIVFKEKAYEYKIIFY